MTKRFEIKLPEDRRAALDALANQTGVSASDLARLAINQMLEDRDVKLPRAVVAA
jgi:predicted transcriptional regulator